MKVSKRNKKQRDLKKDTTPLQPGEKLRLAREARSLSIEDVAARLKLDAKKINAMEQGDVAGIATPVFAVGYLRTYARLLELSEADVLDDFDELKPAQDEAADSVAASVASTNAEDYGKVANEMPSQFSLADKPKGVRIGLIGFVLVALIALTYFMWSGGELEQSGIVDAANKNVHANVTEKVVEAAIPAPEVGSEKDIQDTAAVNDLGQLAESESQAVELNVKENLAEAKMEISVASDVSESAVETVSAGLKSELILSFNSDSWAEVQDALGQRLIYRLGKSGSRRAVTGVAPFMVQLGYVQGVDIFYNGTEYDLSKYANRRSVRLRIGKAGDHMSSE